MEPVLERDQPPRLRIVHPPRVDHGHPGETRRDPPHQVRPDAAVQVHQVRALVTDQAGQAGHQQQVRVAVHRQSPDPRDRCRGLPQGAARGAGEQVLVAARVQAAQQVQDLEGTAVEVPAALHMQDPQGAVPSTAWAAARTSPTPRAFMQVKSALQVGRRRHGEQGCRW